MNSIRNKARIREEDGKSDGKTCEEWIPWSEISENIKTDMSKMIL